MRIAFYAPFKPLGHKNPSGDLVIATGLVDFLEKNGHKIEVQSRLRARWIYFKPWIWLFFLAEVIKSFRRLRKKKPDIWLTYHTYYKAPDLLGPVICRLLSIKYVVFQGIYSTKRRRRFSTWPGFYLNRFALLSADHVFTNKQFDFKNLRRIIPDRKLTYIKSGIYPDTFQKDEAAGLKLRKHFGIEKTCPVILSACMFRDDVKTKGLSWLIRCCGRLAEEGIPFHMLIAGAGKMEKSLKMLAGKHLSGRVTFAGRIDRSQMYQFYSSGDIFAFPGIRESLGMVYLEAQSCGLPVVAFDNGGIPEVLIDRKTGILIPMYDCTAYSKILAELLSDQTRRFRMGTDAAQYVRANHDLAVNYKNVEQNLQAIVTANG